MAAVIRQLTYQITKNCVVHLLAAIFTVRKGSRVLKKKMNEIYHTLFIHLNIVNTVQDYPNLAKNALFSNDGTALALLSQNNELTAMKVCQTNPVGVELFSYVNTFFSSGKIFCWTRG